MKKHSLNQHQRQTRRSSARVLFSAILAGTASVALAGTEMSTSSDVYVEEESAFSKWWNGKQMVPFPGRDTLADYGLKLSGKWNGAYYGVIQSQNGQKGFFDQEVAFAGELDFAKLTGIEAIEGLKAYSGVRWRQPSSGSTPGPNEYVEAQSLFNPSHYQSGTQWRLINAILEYSTPEMFGIEEFLTIKGGWIQPQKEFIDQPLSKMFLNNAIESSKGIGGNIPFSSSFTTWGGTLEVKPTSETYIKGGLFMAYPESTSNGNHGLAFEGFAQDPNKNGLMAMGEIGWKPSFGASELPGHYAMGGYYYGQENTSFYGEVYDEQWGLYWQADQMLYREPSAPADAVEPIYSKKGGSSMASDGKSYSGKNFKEPVVMEETKLSDQGLYTFNIITFAPKYNNRYPFYFHSGFVYKGLIPGRDKDQLMAAVAIGQHSYNRIQDLQQDGNPNQSNLTTLIEAGYRFQINGWAFTQPFVQYLNKPDGTEDVANAWVLGVLSGVTF